MTPTGDSLWNHKGSLKGSSTKISLGHKLQLHMFLEFRIVMVIGGLQRGSLLNLLSQPVENVLWRSIRGGGSMLCNVKEIYHIMQVDILQFSFDVPLKRALSLAAGLFNGGLVESIEDVFTKLTFSSITLATACASPQWNSDHNVHACQQHMRVSAH